MLTCAEPALHPADKRDGEGIDAARDAGDVHQVAGEDEEGHGEQREALDAGDHALGHDDVGRDAASRGGRAATRPPSTMATGRPRISRTRKEPMRISMSETDQFQDMVVSCSDRSCVEGVGPLENGIAAAPVLDRAPGPSARTSARRRRRHAVETSSSASMIVVMRSSATIVHVAPEEPGRVGEEDGADDVDTSRTEPRDACRQIVDRGRRPGCAARGARTWQHPRKTTATRQLVAISSVQARACCSARSA